MTAWLRSQQLSEAHGWKRADVAYGAWGMGGEPRIAPNAGHIDMSMTRYVLQALAAAEISREDPAWARARVFVERCQNPDEDSSSRLSWWTRTRRAKDRTRGIAATGPRRRTGFWR